MPGLRSEALRVAVTGCLVIAVAAPAAAAPREPEMVAKINEARQRHGLPPLRPAHSLERSAHAFAGHLMRIDRFAHAARIRASSRFRLLGEALAMHRGRRPRRSGTVRRWLASPGHRALVLSRSFGRMGAGRAVGRFRGRPATIWVLQLGSY
jgi:uncharacterized protein YkwD